MNPAGLHIVNVIDALPDDFAAMRAEALAEGFRHLERLALDWASGAIRFDQPGEALLAAQLAGALAGIGGLTIDPAVAGALRMRRFYVRAPFRRRGVAAALARALIARASRATRVITANAPPEAAAFWQSVGFVPDRRDGHTHVMRLS